MFSFQWLMYIGEVAKRTGASQKAIRLYESMGLLGPIQRQGAYRAYSEANVRQVQMIRQAQALGFRLSEVLPLVPSDAGAPDWSQLLRQLELKRASIAREVAQMKRLDAQLESIMVEIRDCTSNDPGADLGDCASPR